METIQVNHPKLGTINARPPWMESVKVQDFYSASELNSLQYAYILQLEDAARQLAQVDEGNQELRDTIDMLTTQLRDAQRNHRHDITLISERLLQEAESRDWCHVYDEVIADLNSNLTYQLETREREFDLRVQVSGVLRIMVRATSEDDAEERARDMIDFDAWSTGDSDIELYYGSIDDITVQ